MIECGFGRREITPKPGVRLGGYGIRERPAEEVFDPLHVTCVALRSGEVETLVVSLDWLNVDFEYVNRMRRKLARATGVTEAAINLFTIHTHSGPNITGSFGWGEPESAYLDSVAADIITAAREACGNMVEAQVGLAVTESKVGLNRRGLNSKGEVGLIGDPDAEIDPWMTVIAFRALTGKYLGILVHYGAHGTAMGCNRLVSRDWSGIMMDRVELQFGAPTVFLPGAIGDVGPRTNSVDFENHTLRAGTGDGIESVREVGYRAASDAIAALLSIKEFRADLPLAAVTRPAHLDYAPLESLESARRTLAKYETVKEEWGEGMCEYMHAQAVIEAHDQPRCDALEYLQSGIALGPLAIIPIPGEVFSEISLRIRHRSPFAYTLVASVANGSIGYIPTREERARGGYEPFVGKAFGAYLLADHTDDSVVDNAVGLLDDLQHRLTLR